MRTSLELAVYGDWTPSGQLLLWAFSGDGERVAARELKLLLFADDPDSYYGAAVETWESDLVEGVSLGAEEAMAFFERPPVHPLVAVTWHAGLEELHRSAASVRRAIRSGSLLPSYRSWVEGKLRWTADRDREPLLAEMLAGSEAVQRLAHGLLLGEARRNAELRAAIEQLTNWNGPFPPESEWLYLTGWLRDESPFRPALRLAEPDDPERSPEWELSFVLIGRDGDETMLVCDPEGRPASLPPEDWTPYLPRAEAAFRLWLRAVPEIAQSADPLLLKSKLDETEAWRFLTDGSERLAAHGGLVLLPSWWERLRAARPKLKADLRAHESKGEPPIFGVDQVLRFDWKLSIGDVELSEEEFRTLADGHRRLHYIRGQWIWLDEALIEQIRKMMEKSRKQQGITLKEVLHRHLAGKAAAEAEASPPGPEAPPVDWEIAMGPRLREWIRQLTRQTEFPPFAPPAAFRGTLRSYQAKGVAWLLNLRRFGFGACLADDMGLGKTVQYIAYLLKVKELQPEAGPSLLICPTSLIGNWQKELERFAPTLRVHLHYGSGRPKGAERFAAAAGGCDLVLTTYMTALLDITELCGVHWTSLCLDEAQNIKNASAKQSAAIRKIPAAHRIAMTGTPMENRLSELWSIFDFINPGYLGGPAQFRKRYAHALARGHQPEAAEALRRLIRPFLLRRMKSDPLIVPDLPDKVESKVYVPLTREQAALYESVLDRLLRGIGNRSGPGRRGAILAALTRLKQICDHPALYLKERRGAVPSAADSHKAARLLEMVRELRREGDRCLIFTQFAEMGYMLKQLLEHSLREPVLYLFGGTPKAERDRMVALFQSGDGSGAAPGRGRTGAEQPGIFVLSLKAGGTGLNLTAANHVFHYDRWWNPAVENQATDRAYRIGQGRLVQVHKFIALGTLEERIDELIERKTGLTRQITGTGEEWLTELSTEELRELFALRREWLED